LEFYCMVLGYPEYKPAIGPTRCLDRQWLMDRLLLHRDTITTEPVDQAGRPSDQVLSDYSSAEHPSDADEVVTPPRPPTHSPNPPSPPEQRTLQIRVPPGPTNSGGGSDVVPSKGGEFSTIPSPSSIPPINKHDLLYHSGGGLCVLSPREGILLEVNS
jgi:hypothetical protein